MTRLHDVPGITNGFPRKWYLAEVKKATNDGLDSAPWLRIAYDTRKRLRPPTNTDERLVVDARGFAPEGNDSLSLFVVRA